MCGKIRDLLLRHNAKMATDFEPIADGIGRVDLMDGEARRLLHRQLHTMKGSSGSLGYGAIFSSAERLERLLADCIATAPSPQDAARIKAEGEILGALVAHAQITDSALYTKFGLAEPTSAPDAHMI